MRVCDLCKSKNVDIERVKTTFQAITTGSENNKLIPKYHELSCEKEICFDCCRKLQKLFKKGGESK